MHNTQKTSVQPHRAHCTDFHLLVFISIRENHVHDKETFYLAQNIQCIRAVPFILSFYFVYSLVIHSFLQMHVICFYGPTTTSYAHLRQYMHAIAM